MATLFRLILESPLVAEVVARCMFVCLFFPCGKSAISSLKQIDQNCRHFAMATDILPSGAGLGASLGATQSEMMMLLFQQLKDLSDRLANALIHKCQMQRAGQQRVAILLPQCPETAISHVAAYKMGAIALPLFTLFGPEALQYRLRDSGTTTIITNEESLPKILEIKEQLPELRNIILTRTIDSSIENVVPVADRGVGEHVKLFDFNTLLQSASNSFEAVKTLAEDAALIIYTSGTTGPPKGCLHAHRVLPGHMPGVEFPQNFFPQAGDLFHTPADWAWIGGLCDVLLPSLLHGIPVLAHRSSKFDPEHEFHLLAKHRVRNVFMPPTALKIMRQVSNPRSRHDIALRSIGSGGESLGEEILEWGRRTFGLNINEFYGQTEANLLVGNSEMVEIVPGSMGRAIPGRKVDVIDSETGQPVGVGETGEVAVCRPDPVMFLKYWNNEEASRKKFTADGKWMKTGDLAKKDDRGNFLFVGRSDDLINSAGYRIGPTEIEDCLLKHRAVSISAAVGSPDALRNEIVKAFVVLRDEFEEHPDKQALARDIQEFVKKRLAAHEYPREVEFVRELPMTTTGKIQRNVLRQREIERKKQH